MEAPGFSWSERGSVRGSPALLPGAGDPVCVQTVVCAHIGVHTGTPTCTTLAPVHTETHVHRLIRGAQQWDEGAACSVCRKSKHLPKPSFINPQIPPPAARLPGTGGYGLGLAAQQERFYLVPDLGSPGPRGLRYSSGARGHGVHLLRLRAVPGLRGGNERGRDGGHVPGGRLP